MNEETRAFIREHREDDIRVLALQGRHPVGVDMPWALEQIAGWQAARRKLPSWAAVEGIVFPPRLSMEQCSSEPTARYKVGIVQWLMKTGEGAASEELVEGTLSGEVAGGTASEELAEGAASEKLAEGTVSEQLAERSRGKAFADLTGGFGVDFSFLSRLFERSVYVEQQPVLCDVARANFRLLGLHGVEVINGDCTEALTTLDHLDLIYLDPARRDLHGQRTFAISDCTPDVLLLRDELLRRSRWVLVKLSPMLDWHKAVDDLGGCVHEVHIVAVGNECKELLLVMSSQPCREPVVCCVNDDEVFRFSPCASPTLPLVEGRPEGILCEPHAAIMKAGCFGELSARFGIPAIAPNSHLFVAPQPIDGFPGRQYSIERVTSFSKKELRLAMEGITKANVSVRNFPLTAEQLRRRLKVTDGGETHIFGTTTARQEHILVVCRRIFFEKKAAIPS